MIIILSNNSSSCWAFFGCVQWDILYFDQRWVNEGYGESCLEVAEELANQTPVRLDLLLSLVPPPESTDTVVVSAKTDQPASTVSSKSIICIRM